jgi:8-oxo-dGTP pyrophosphatase MutT (NUDIX family)
MSKDSVDKLLIYNEETLLRTRVGSIVSAKVQNRRTGSEHEFYRLIFADWVNVVALTADHEIVLIKQYRFGSRCVELEIPGGAVEEGESPLAAGQRELLEETGYAGKNARIIGEVRPNPAIQNNRCFTVLVEEAKLVAGQSMDEMEDIEVVVVPYEQVDGLVASAQITHGLVLNALMFYAGL